MTIAERAADAHQLLQQRTTDLPAPRYKAADLTRAARRLAALLGIDPVHVRLEQTGNVITLPLKPLILYVRDPDDPGTQYTFWHRDPLYEDEPFCLMGPCPRCYAVVPLAEIRALADLGAFLATGPASIPENNYLPGSYSDEFDRHPAHTAKCPFNTGDS